MSGAHSYVYQEPKPAFGKIYPGYPRRLVKASGRSKIACLWNLEYLIEYCRYGHERYLSTREFQARYRSLPTGAPLRHASAVDGRNLALAEMDGREPLLKLGCDPAGGSPQINPLRGVEPSEQGWGVLYAHEPRYWFAKRLSVRKMAVCCELKRRAGNSRIALVSVSEIAAVLGIPGSAVKTILNDLNSLGVVEIVGEESNGNMFAVEMLAGFLKWSCKLLDGEPVLLDGHSSQAVANQDDGVAIKHQHSKGIPETGPPDTPKRTSHSLKPDRIPNETGPKLEPEPKNLRENSQWVFQSQLLHGLRRFESLLTDLGVCGGPASTGKITRELRRWISDGLDAELASSSTWESVKGRLEKSGVPVWRYPFRAVDILQDERGAFLRYRKAKEIASVESAISSARTAQLEQEALQWMAISNGNASQYSGDAIQHEGEGKDAI